MFTYWISPRGPSSLGKLRVLNAWMPASWSPSNCVILPEQPASLASFGSPNHSPRWRVCTGSNFGFFSASWLSTCGAFTLPGANTNNSSLKIPLARTSPLPWLLVVKSAWYQEMPKGLLGCWVTNSSNSVFLGAWLTVTSIIWLSVGVVRTSTLALAPSRQSLSTAAWERTILKGVVLPTAKAAAAARAATTNARITSTMMRLITHLLSQVRGLEAFSSILRSVLAERQTSQSRKTPRKDDSSHATDNHPRSSPIQEQLAPCLRAFVSTILKTLVPKKQANTSIVSR